MTTRTKKPKATYQAFGSLCSITIQTQNNAMSALTCFGKITHELKNREASG